MPVSKTLSSGTLSTLKDTIRKRHHRNERKESNGDAFVEEVWRERYRELVFEFHTWFDILRTRKFPQTDLSNPGTINFVDVVGHTNNWGKTYEAKHLLFPLSDNERQRNPNLGENNPGY